MTTTTNRPGLPHEPLGPHYAWCESTECGDGEHLGPVEELNTCPRDEVRIRLQLDRAVDRDPTTGVDAGRVYPSDVKMTLINDEITCDPFTVLLPSGAARRLARALTRQADDAGANRQRRDWAESDMAEG